MESKNPYKLIEKEIRFEVTRGRGGTGGEGELDGWVPNSLCFFPMTHRL